LTIVGENTPKQIPCSLNSVFNTIDKDIYRYISIMSHTEQILYTVSQKTHTLFDFFVFNYNKCPIS